MSDATDAAAPAVPTLVAGSDVQQFSGQLHALLRFTPGLPADSIAQMALDLESLDRVKPNGRRVHGWAFSMLANTSPMHCWNKYLVARYGFGKESTPEVKPIMQRALGFDSEAEFDAATTGDANLHLALLTYRLACVTHWLCNEPVSKSVMGMSPEQRELHGLNHQDARMCTVLTWQGLSQDDGTAQLLRADKHTHPHMGHYGKLILGCAKRANLGGAGGYKAIAVHAHRLVAFARVAGFALTRAPPGQPYKQIIVRHLTSQGAVQCCQAGQCILASHLLTGSHSDNFKDAHATRKRRRQAMRDRIVTARQRRWTPASPAQAPAPAPAPT